MLGPELLMDVPAALWKCWAPRYWWTYQRRCVNAGPKGFDVRAGTFAGQPTRELVGRVTVVESGNPAVFFNMAGALEQTTQELYTVSVRLELRLCSLNAAHRFGRIFHFGIFGPIIRGRQDGPGFRRRLPGPWPAAWTRGGVGNCQLKLSYVFSFVVSGCVDDDRPSYPHVKGMCTDVDGCGLYCVCSRGTLVVLLSTVSRNVSVCLPGWRVALS